MAASFVGHPHIVRILIESKAQINAQKEVSCSFHQKMYCTTLSFCSQDGFTALHLAAQEGKVDVVGLLTEAKAWVNIQTEVHTLCHVWSTDQDSHFISHHRGKNI